MPENFRSLVGENPMRIEIERFRRRFLTPSSPAVNRTLLGLAALCYSSLVITEIVAHDSFTPFAMVGIQLAVLTLIAPLLTYGSISGERERRSWDMLLVSPVSKTQILAGKFLAASSALLTISALFLLPILIAWAKFGDASAYDLALAEGIVVSFSALLSAFALLVSVRTTRITNSLVTTLGLTVTVLAILPAAISSLLRDTNLIGALFYAHPYFALANLYTYSEYYSNPTRTFHAISPNLPAWAFGWPHIILYSGMAYLMLVQAVQQLKKEERG